MSGFAATSGKYEVFAPGSDTYVMFNDSNDINAISSLAFTKVLELYSLRYLKLEPMQQTHLVQLVLYLLV